MVSYRLLMPQDEQQLLSGTKASRNSVRLNMMVAVSFVGLAASLYAILSGAYDERTQKWAFGAVGSIVGLWIKDSQALRCTSKASFHLPHMRPRTGRHRTKVAQADERAPVEWIGVGPPQCKLGIA